MSSELNADGPQVGASTLTELDADGSAGADPTVDVEQPKDVTPAVNKSANHKSSLKDSIMSHNLERDHVS